MEPSCPNVFSVDVEEYFQVSAFEKQFPRDRWDSIPSRLERGLETVLAVAAAANVRGTFYVLGWVARKYPALLRRITAAGHEIGCHSLEHRLIYAMDEPSFRADLRQARSLIEDATGAACLVYRAPSFSVTRKSLWALRTLAEEGIPTAVYYSKPLHLQGAYRHYPVVGNGLPVAEQAARQVLSLPMHPYLEPETQDRIADAIRRAAARASRRPDRGRSPP